MHLELKGHAGERLHPNLTTSRTTDEHHDKMLCMWHTSDLVLGGGPLATTSMKVTWHIHVRDPARSAQQTFKTVNLNELTVFVTFKIAQQSVYSGL